MSQPPPYYQPQPQQRSCAPTILLVLIGSFALIVFTCCGLPCIIGVMMPKPLDTGDKHWDAGRKADAASIYGREIDGFAPSNEPRIYTRTIEHHLGAGNTDQAKHFAELAAERNIDVSTAPENVRTAVTTAKAELVKKKEEERIAAEKRREERATAKAVTPKEEKPKVESNPNEIDKNGLVLLWDTVEGKQGNFGGEISGTIVNRRGRKLSYAQVSFNLYDTSGAQVGSAFANINGLEPGSRWNFKASSLGKDFKTFKLNEMSGF